MNMNNLLPKKYILPQQKIPTLTACDNTSYFYRARKIEVF